LHQQLNIEVSVYQAIGLDYCIRGMKILAMYKRAIKISKIPTAFCTEVMKKKMNRRRGYKEISLPRLA